MLQKGHYLHQEEYKFAPSRSISIHFVQQRAIGSVPRIKSPFQELLQQEDSFAFEASQSLVVAMFMNFVLIVLQLLGSFL